MDGRPNRRIEAAFSYFSDIVGTLPKIMPASMHAQAVQR